MQFVTAQAADARWHFDRSAAEFTMQIDGQDVLVRVSREVLADRRPHEPIRDPLDATRERWLEIENVLDGILRRREPDGSVLIRAADVQRDRERRAG